MEKNENKAILDIDIGSFAVGAAVVLVVAFWAFVLLDAFDVADTFPTGAEDLGD